ncbi:MAG: hypothetical protein AUJ98_10815 [Bacteroidetes bacterium CG2_30_33_31]|nr:MAG: hypothetical protein AUJ98_10815 [Bacteroidetes bacterium CG2_30_33_31]
MSNFRFKKFSLIDDNTPMKIGMDSIMLGCWANADNSKSALDIGSGCGLLAFMLAQKYPKLKITAVEVYEEAYLDAVENLSNFPLEKHIQFFNSNILQWDCENKFDLIICNPPYFKGDLKPLELGRSFARFQDFLPLENLIHKSKSLMSEDGLISMIISKDNFIELNKICMSNGLFLSRTTSLKHRFNSKIKRILVEYSLNYLGKIIRNEIVVQDSYGKYSDDYKKLTQDFYLEF